MNITTKTVHVYMHVHPLFSQHLLKTLNLIGKQVARYVINCNFTLFLARKVYNLFLKRAKNHDLLEGEHFLEKHKFCIISVYHLFVF